MADPLHGRIQKVVFKTTYRSIINRSLRTNILSKLSNSVVNLLAYLVIIAVYLVSVNYYF